MSGDDSSDQEQPGLRTTPDGELGCGNLSHPNPSRPTASHPIRPSTASATDPTALTPAAPTVATAPAAIGVSTASITASPTTTAPAAPTTAVIAVTGAYAWVSQTVCVTEKVVTVAQLLQVR